MSFFYKSLFIYIFLCAAGVSAGTLEDIRAKTGWEPGVHSERQTAYCPLITPAELIGYLDKYQKDKIKMQVLFNKITNTGLNKWIGPEGRRHMWSSKRYIAFRIKDLQKQISSSSIYLFLNKGNPCEKILLELVPDTKITVTGLVKDTDSGKAWIEVSKISLGWEE